MDKKKILWVDDEISSFNRNVRDLSRDYDVTVADTSEDAIRLMDNKKFDFFIFDMDLSSKLRGRDLANQVRSFDKDVPIAILSSYISDFERSSFANRARSLSFLNKSEFLSDDAKRSLSSKIAALLEEEWSRRENDLQLSSPVADPFDVRLSHYQLLTSEQKYVLLMEAKRRLRSELKQIFDDGYIWALFCGGSREPIAVESDIKMIPSNQKIAVIAERFDAAPYSFFQTGPVDDLGLMKCSSRSGLESYPKVSLRFPDAIDSAWADTEIHFDTGSSMTFLSAEHLSEEVALRDKGFPTLVDIRGEDFAAYRADIDVFVGTDLDQLRQSLAAKLRAFVIVNWKRCSLARSCDQSCENWFQSESKNDGLCLRRRGLIGRNFLQENDFSVTIQGSTTFFNRERFKKF